MTAPTDMYRHAVLDIDEEDQGIESVEYAQLDLKRAASEMTAGEARFLVDYYYQVQEYRKRTMSQAKAMAGANEPTILTNWLAQQSRSTESHIKKYLEAWAGESPVGRWSMSQLGIGPVIAAGLMAHIDINRAPHVSHIYSYAGLNPKVEWLGKERAAALLNEIMGKRQEVTEDDIIAASNLTWRNAQNLRGMAANDENQVTRSALRNVLARRPWNADLKVLCWKIGDCIVKFSNNPKSYYGPLYKQRKAKEQEMNARGAFKDQADHILATKNFSRDTKAREAYEKGMLPDGHIHQRAARFATKVFLAHWHQVAFETTFNRPASLPYVTTVMLHEDYMVPPGYTPLPR